LPGFVCARILSSPYLAYLAVERNVKRHGVQLFQTLKNIAGAAGPAFKRYIDMLFRLGRRRKV